MHEALTRASATQPCSGDKGGSSTRPQNKLIVSLYGSEDRCEMEKLGIRHRASLRSTTNAHSKGNSWRRMQQQEASVTTKFQPVYISADRCEKD